MFFSIELNECHIFWKLTPYERGLQIFSPVP